jgi:hypothetical protein
MERILLSIFEIPQTRKNVRHFDQRNRPESLSPHARTTGLNIAYGTNAFSSINNRCFAVASQIKMQFLSNCFVI